VNPHRPRRRKAALRRRPSPRLPSTRNNGPRAEAKIAEETCSSISPTLSPDLLRHPVLNSAHQVSFYHRTRTGLVFPHSVSPFCILPGIDLEPSPKRSATKREGIALPSSLATPDQPQSSRDYPEVRVRVLAQWRRGWSRPLAREKSCSRSLIYLRLDAGAVSCCSRAERGAQEPQPRPKSNHGFPEQKPRL